MQQQLLQDPIYSKKKTKKIRKIKKSLKKIQKSKLGNFRFQLDWKLGFRVIAKNCKIEKGEMLPSWLPLSNWVVQGHPLLLNVCSLEQNWICPVPLWWAVWWLCCQTPGIPHSVCHSYVMLSPWQSESNWGCELVAGYIYTFLRHRIWILSQIHWSRTVSVGIFPPL